MSLEFVSASDEIIRDNDISALYTILIDLIKNNFGLPVYYVGCIVLDDKFLLAEETQSVFIANQQTRASLVYI